MMFFRYSFIDIKQSPLDNLSFINPSKYEREEDETFFGCPIIVIQSYSSIDFNFVTFIYELPNSMFIMRIGY